MFLFFVLSIVGRLFSQKGTSSLLGLHGDGESFGGGIPPASADLVGGSCASCESSSCESSSCESSGCESSDGSGDS